MSLLEILLEIYFANICPCGERNVWKFKKKAWKSLEEADQTLIDNMGWSQTYATIHTRTRCQPNLWICILKLKFDLIIVFKSSCLVFSFIHFPDQAQQGITGRWEKHKDVCKRTCVWLCLKDKWWFSASWNMFRSVYLCVEYMNNTGWFARNRGFFIFTFKKVKFIILISPIAMISKLNRWRQIQSRMKKSFEIFEIRTWEQ